MCGWDGELYTHFFTLTVFSFNVNLELADWPWMSAVAYGYGGKIFCSVHFTPFYLYFVRLYYINVRRYVRDKFYRARRYLKDVTKINLGFTSTNRVFFQSI